MHVSVPIKVLFAGALTGATAILMWRSNAVVMSHSSSEVHQDSGPPTRVALRASPASAQPALPASNLNGNWRAQFRESRNYAEFVRGLAGAATAGDPAAQCLTARALKYCNDSSNLERNRGTRWSISCWTPARNTRRLRSMSEFYVGSQPHRCDN